MSATLLENVSGLVDQIQGLARQAHAEYSPEVDTLIADGSRDKDSVIGSDPML